MNQSILPNLKNQLDEIDLEYGSKAAENLCEGKFNIKIGMWKKGEAVSTYASANVETSYNKLSQITDRADHALKRWHELYLKYPKFEDYLPIAKQEARQWTQRQIEGKKQIENQESQIKFNETNENIEWAKWSWNPVTGCKHDCLYCYARDIANRFYKEKFEPTFRPHRLKAPWLTKIPKERERESGINNVFVCSMGDLFGDWVPQEWIDKVMEATKKANKWNFLYLTKNPERYIGIRWPENSWVGTTVDCQAQVERAEKAFKQFDAPIKFVSCEPLNEQIIFSDLKIFDWLIIGGRSKTSKMKALLNPPLDWIISLFSQAEQAGRSIYCKPNLLTLKEYPK